MWWAAGVLQVRVWSIPEQKVVHAEDCHEMVTAVTFSPGGQRAVVGTMKGKCRFFNVEPGFSLEYDAQIGSIPPLSQPPCFLFFFPHFGVCVCVRASACIGWGACT